MRSPKRKLFLVLLLAGVVLGLWLSGLHQALTFERIREERTFLIAFVQQRYLASVLLFILLTVSTAFFVPGAIVLMAGAGFFYGVTAGALFSVTGLTLGATTAFLAARYMLGDWVQERYRVPLFAFNEEMKRHGHYYLLTLRIVPVLPFFLVNFLAGMTKIPLKKYIAMTCLGLLPASFVYAFAGRRLGSINSPGDILSPGIMAALLLLAAFILLPVILKTIRRFRKKNRPPSGG